MSTIKSSSADLTLNADGSGNDIILQSNASQVGSLTAEGVLTATSFAGSGASLTGLTSSQMPAGSVLQVVSGYTTTEVTTTSASYSDTGLSCAITPSATSSSVLIIAHQSFGKGASNTQIDAQLLRGASVVLSNWLNDDVRTSDTQSIYLPPAALVYIDSPSTTSATTYKTQFRNAAAAGTVYVNTNSGHAKIILMEIAG